MSDILANLVIGIILQLPISAFPFRAFIAITPLTSIISIWPCYFTLKRFNPLFLDIHTWNYVCWRFETDSSCISISFFLLFSPTNVIVLFDRISNHFVIFVDYYCFHFVYNKWFYSFRVTDFLPFSNIRFMPYTSSSVLFYYFVLLLVRNWVICSFVLLANYLCFIFRFPYCFNLSLA